MLKSARATLVALAVGLVCPAVAAAQELAWYPVPYDSYFQASGSFGAGALPDGRLLLIDLDGQHAFYTPAQGFTPTALPSGPRVYEVFVPLADGRLMAASGYALNPGSYFDQFSRGVDVYDPNANTWTSVAPMNFGRTFARGVRMLDGRVLVAGGSNDFYPIANTVEIYDPAQDAWQMAASMNVGRFYTAGSQPFDLLPLADGRVLALGGAWGFPPEVYDPIANLWSYVANVGSSATAVKLADGRVLVAGGTLSGTAAQIFDTTSSTWVPVAPMPIGRGLGVGLTLADGRVLVAGGYTVEGSTNSVFYDPTENAWTLGPPMPQQFGLTSALFELPDGRVLATEQSGAEVLRLLRAPVAVEPDQTVGGASGFVSAVTLDGSASSDPDSDALARYVWSEGATVLADGTSPTAPVGLAVGTHHLTLTVTDDTGMSGSTNFTVVVQDLVAAGQEALAACTSTLTSTQAALMACTTTLTPTQAALTAANGTIASLQAQITLVQQDLRTALGDPSFTIPGATPVEQMQSLTTAISSLSSGPKKALYEALGGTKKKK